MLATLPRKQADDVSGELLVEVYERQLGGYPQQQIEYLTDRAIETCRWFPTVAECHDICANWRRVDSFTGRRADALSAIYREEELRKAQPKDVWRPTKEEIAEVHRLAAESLKA